MPWPPTWPPGRERRRSRSDPYIEAAGLRESAEAGRPPSAYRRAMSGRPRDSGTVAVVVGDPYRHHCCGDVEDVLARVPGVEVVATATDRFVAGELLRRLEPDVAVIDMALLSTCEFPLHGWGPVPHDIRLIAVGFDTDAATIAHLRSAGFAGLVARQRLAEDLPGLVLGDGGEARALSAARGT